MTGQTVKQLTMITTSDKNLNYLISVEFSAVNFYMKVPISELRININIHDSG